MPISKPDFNLIFASQAPSQDLPAAFNNYARGWDEARKNNGKPTIKQFNYLIQQLDLKALWMIQNGAALPFDETVDYAEGSVVVKDDELKQWKDGVWKPITADTSHLQSEIDAINDALLLKTDKTYVDSQDSSLQYQINQKAETTYVDNALSNLSTVASKFYPTLAEANTDIANIEVNQVVNIGETTNGGLWYKATAEATVLTKSDYDPVELSKQYVNAIKELIDEDIQENRESITKLVLSLHSLSLSLSNESSYLRSQIGSFLSTVDKIQNESDNQSNTLSNYIVAMHSLVSIITSLKQEIDQKENASAKVIVAQSVTVDTEVPRAETPASISNDGTKLWTQGDNILRESTDGGKTWSVLHTFSGNHFVEWVKELDNGELLLQVIYFVYSGSKKVRDRYSIYRTSGKGAESMTLVECFTIEPEGVFAHHAWSVSIHNNIVLVGEYGAKVPTWAGKPVEDGDNARYVRMSLDYGKTWKIIFDLNERSETPNNKGLHVHGVCYDQYWNRIWVTHGDGFWGETATLYSDDLGETWTYAQRYKKIEESNTATDGYRHQNVGIIALPTCVLFGTDGFPDGVQRIDRKHGKHPTNGLYPIDSAYFIDNGQSSINYVCSSISYAKNTDFSPVLFGFTAETSAAKSCVIATYDGFKFFKVWEDTLSQPSGKGLDFVCGVTLRNEVIIRSNDSRTTGTGKRTKITLKV